MPQGPIAVANTTVAGGTTSKLNITAAAVVKAGPGRLARIVVVAPGTTGGALTINDCLTVAAAAASNEILSIGFAGLTAGQVIDLEFPCLVGIVVSAVPSAGSPVFSISYQ